MDDATQEFDLLADGELSEARRRELLGRLDEQPDGWRRCALAFLEAQDWRREMPRAMESVESDSVADATPDAADRTSAAAVAARPPLGWFGTMLAMAASFALALGIGVAWRGGWWRTGTPHQVLRPESGEVATSEPRTTGDEPAVESPVVAKSHYGTVKVSVIGADGQQQQVEVPVVAVDKFDPTLIGQQPAGLPEDLVRQLRRAGHEVQQYRELVPVSLEDGSQLVLPIDQVEIRFVNHGYQ